MINPMVELKIVGLGMLVWLMTQVSPAEAAPKVLTSLKPLALIAQEIAGADASVENLVPVTGSHHDYPLKPSDYQRLQQADLVIWVGPELESFLQKPLLSLPVTKVLGLYGLPGLHWPTDTHETAEGHDHPGERDPHIWLDPRNAQLIAAAICERLSAIDPGNSQHYRRNLQQFNQEAQQLDQALAARLKPVAGRGFAVYHEGFDHFVGRYGLHQLDYVTFTPEQKPGARHLAQLREHLAKEGVCLFLEPYNESPSAKAMAQELHLRLGSLDAMGATAGITRYGQLLDTMAQAFLTCLADGRSERRP